MWSYSFNFTTAKLSTCDYSSSKTKFRVYFNGRRLNAQFPICSYDEYIAVPKIFESHVKYLTSVPTATVSLSIPITQETDAGMYEFVVLMPTDQAGFGEDCCEDYHRFLTDPDGLHLRYFVAGLAEVELKLTSKNFSVCNHTCCQGLYIIIIILYVRIHP